MRAIHSFSEIYLCRQFVDFRKSINGLSEIVQTELKLRPLDGALFVFLSRRRDRVKILYWDKTGFALWYKRLEEAKFCWLPKSEHTEARSIVLSKDQLEWLLSGVDIWKIKKHKVVEYEQIG